MKLKFKNNFFGYFTFFYSGTGNKLIINFALCIVVSFLDGIGLAMFIPLLQGAGSSEKENTTSHASKSNAISDFLANHGIVLTINMVLIAIVCLFVTKGIIKFIQLNYQVNLRFSFIASLRNELVDKLHFLSYKGFLKLDAGRIQNVLTTEMQKLYQGLTAYFNSAQSFVMCFTYVLLAFIANFQFAFFVAAGAILSNFIYRKIYIITKKNSFELSKKGNKFNSFLIQAIHNFKYLKSTNYMQQFSVKLKNVIGEMESLNKKIGFYNAITQSIKEPVIIIIVVLVINVELHLMHASLNSIILSLLLFYRALSFLVVIQNNWQMFINNIGAMNSIANLSDEMTAMEEEQKDKKFSVFTNAVVLDKVNFSYGNSKVISEASIKIYKNKTIALVGESGSGKTTLANLIASLIEPDNGSIKADGISLFDYNLNSYRTKIGYISQEPVIFNDDIFNNITFWAEPNKENLQSFWKATELASLKNFIITLPEAEHTNLGDNGILISGGQKQRISIARELYKNAEILIMDEATSALDSETEKSIQENIERLHGSYTMVIIAHRLSTIKQADLIYLLDKGRVIASGTFSEMIGRSERFKRMVALQEI